MSENQAPDTPAEPSNKPAMEKPQGVRTIELQQEAKLKAKFPNLKQKGPSTILQKRLQKQGGRQFFDSGDYQMAKARMNKGALPPQASVPPVEATKSPEQSLEDVTGHDHPTPSDVPHLLPGGPQRKASIHGASKLTSSPTADLASPPILS